MVTSQKHRTPSPKPIRGFPNIRGTLLGAPIIQTRVYWGLYWGTLILASFHTCVKVAGMWGHLHKAYAERLGDLRARQGLYEVL